VAKAFELRARTSEYERLYITAYYYFDTGQVEKSIQAWDLMKQDLSARPGLAYQCRCGLSVDRAI
jgi:hypothetical protein